ncbi:MAG: FecR domain-containing protein [Spirochaetales bacterium]|nr:FecR domain-containing protein [Spirochaetales bacterium]
MTRKKSVILTTFLILLVGFLGAQTPAAVLEYFDFGIRIWDETGFEKLDFNFGEELGPGFRIETGAGSAELRLNPNGTIMRLASGTSFTIDSIQGRGDSTSTEFTVAQGRVRTVAARSAGADYRFRTATAVGGVRGTDFGMNVVPGQADQLFVLEGSVEFTNSLTNQSLLLGAGQAANTFAPVFEAFIPDPALLAPFLESLQFVALNPQEVPGKNPEGDEGEEDQKDNEQADESSSTDQPAETAQETESSDSSPSGNALTDRILEFLGLEVGSVTINGDTYGKAIFQPKFETGSFRTQLYLPIIYTDDLFDRSTWYRGQGNDEWSFGTDQGDNVPNIVLDVLRDLVLKIKYLEIGDYGDRFFIKLGNIESMTLGHGILINGYANDADFPAIRRLGLNLGVNTDGLGIELLTNDLAEPEIFGARLVWRPLGTRFPLGVGLSAAADINPARELKAAKAQDANVFVGQDNSALKEAAVTADPMFFNFAADVGIPILNMELVDLLLFADFGVMVPYIQNSVTIGTNNVASGFRFDSLIENLELRNYGIQTGVMGKLFIVDYRLEFQYYHGSFFPSFYNQPYDRLRAERTELVLQNLADPGGANVVPRAGIYGSGTVNILPLLDVNIGYRWPWVIGAGSANLSADDYFHIGVQIDKGLLPLGLSGGVQYDRVKFREVFYDDDFALFDENAVVKGNIGVEISPIMDLVLTIGTSIQRDPETGVVQYNANGRPKYGPTVTLETKIGL